MRALLVFAALLQGGCATVPPYERERLARPDMQIGNHADSRAGEELSLIHI